MSQGRLHGSRASASEPCRCVSLGNVHPPDLRSIHPALTGAEAQAACQARGVPTTPIRVRLIRVERPTGEVEVLMTSLLEAETYPAQEFAELYHLRWAQEESDKCFTSRVEVENWSGKSALSIRQDFHGPGPGPKPDRGAGWHRSGDC